MSLEPMSLDAPTLDSVRRLVCRSPPSPYDARVESGILSQGDDAFGRLLLDHMAGEAGQLILELDDGRAGPALPADVFFAEHREWPAEEQRVFESVQGRVLDIGCGPGGTALKHRSAGSTSSPSTSLRVRSRSAGSEECGMCASVPSPLSMRRSVPSIPR